MWCGYSCSIYGESREAKLEASTRIIQPLIPPRVYSWNGNASKMRMMKRGSFLWLFLNRGPGVSHVLSLSLPILNKASIVFKKHSSQRLGNFPRSIGTTVHSDTKCWTLKIWLTKPTLTSIPTAVLVGISPLSLQGTQIAALHYVNITVNNNAVLWATELELAPVHWN